MNWSLQLANWNWAIFLALANDATAVSTMTYDISTALARLLLLAAAPVGREEKEMKHRGRRSRRTKPAKQQVTFERILESSRLACADRAWHRALMASELRHAAQSNGDHHASQTLSRIKLEAARRAYELAPEAIRLGIDDCEQIGLLSISWAGRGRMHLPAATRTDHWLRFDSGLEEPRRSHLTSLQPSAS